MFHKLHKLTKQIITRKAKEGPKQHPNRKEVIMAKILPRRQKTYILLIILGILSAGFGLKGFLLPNGFIDVGVIGISLLISGPAGWPLSLLIILFNIPFIFLGYVNVAKAFAIKTLLVIIGLSFCTFFISYPIITSDKLLVSILGGFFLGAGIGLAMRGGGLIDGTEVLALTVSRNAIVTIGDVVLFTNIIIFSVAGFVLSIETALYSILTYFSATKTFDVLLSGIEEHTGVTIISSCSEKIRNMITNKPGRGVTIYQGKRGYGSHGHQLAETDIIFTVISRLEVSKLTN